jgi:hypothetical protein
MTLYALVPGAPVVVAVEWLSPETSGIFLGADGGRVAPMSSLVSSTVLSSVGGVSRQPFLFCVCVSLPVKYTPALVDSYSNSSTLAGDGYRMRNRATRYGLN